MKSSRIFLIWFFAIFLLFFVQKPSTIVEAEPEKIRNYEEPFLNFSIFFENTIYSHFSNFSPSKEPIRIRAIITAYSSTPWETEGDPFITASGERVREGIVANNFFPFGTKIKIPEIFGEKTFVIKDRMHPRKHPFHFDIWFPSFEEALKFGVKIATVEVLEE